VRTEWQEGHFRSPDPECANKEQRELNPDGSLKRLIPPTPTADELAAKEEKDREAKLEFAARSDAVRRDRNLMQRFPTRRRIARRARRPSTNCGSRAGSTRIGSPS
jgi:hypothetical protein